MSFQVWVHPLTCFMVGWQYVPDDTLELHFGLFSFVWIKD